MENEKRRFKATIDGKPYIFIGDGSYEHMQATADLLNEELSQIEQQLPDTSKEDRALLVAFNALSNQLSMKEQAARQAGSATEQRPKQ
ncbi:cell division protein FtsZ [Lentilactobacillus curieae]|uniref:Cell division protein FtsZ n=1 Tax=Lentilactobacillus curieae TaxID=1138822 RepID=A0A1S6QKS5_9LACO|nr:cell division protein ZapA [Lentilactobacillus curieae]AQW22199.1 cell division protein FtsZ [Lentilactobacillus curieae]